MHAGGAIASYAYDRLNRLIKADYGSGSVISYSYDAAGNRTSQTVVQINHAPSFTKGPDVIVAQNCGLQALPHWATAISPGRASESWQTVDFIVGNDKNFLFTGQPAIGANGTLTFTPVDGRRGTALVSVQLHDNGGTANAGVDISAQQSFTLTVGLGTDSDGDGIADWWTTQYFGHPIGEGSDQSLAEDDPDLDGLSNLQEYQLSRNPLLADNAWLIGGLVHTPGGAGVGGVAVDGLAGTPATDTNGCYSATFTYGWSGSATPSKADDDPPANGVSTLDIALIRRHILGMTLLNSAYKVLAADVNGSGAVSTLDLALIRRVILGITNSFPTGLWRFVPTNCVFSDAQNPWAAPTNRWHTNLVADVTGQDFVAIKLGDVNNSWVSSAPGPAAGGTVTGKDATPVVSLPSVRFEVSSQPARPGERVTARVSVGGFRQATSAQFTLQWDPAVLRYVGVGDFGLRGLSAGSFGAVSAGSGKLTFSWDDPEATGITVADGTTILTVSFDVTGKVGSGSALGFSDLPTAREASVALARAGWESQDGQVAVVGTKPVVACERDPASGMVWVSVPTDAGRCYVLEFAESLSGARWTALASVVGDGTIKALADPGPTNQQRYYRVRIE